MRTSSSHHQRRFLNLLTILALLAVTVPVTVQPVQAVSPDVVISQVYGGGGNSGAPLTHDLPPDNMQLDFTVGFTQFDVCAAPFTPVYDIQGSGAAAAITGNVTTQGVVVGDFEGSSGLQGFYLQDATGDGDATT